MKIILLAVCCLFSDSALSATLSDIKVDNSANLAKVVLNFNGHPVYAFFSLYNTHCVVLNIRQNGVIKGLPLNFSGENIVQQIRNSQTKDKQSIQLVFELTQAAQVYTKMQQSGNQYHVVLTIRGTHLVKRSNALVTTAYSIQNINNKGNPVNENQVSRANNGDSILRNNAVIVAIDAGHGGQDPGASSQHGLHEKNLTITIACKLKAMMARDPMFKPVLTRNGDYFISVMGRSEVARKENANLLVSIHADAAPNHTATGASVWVLSNRRVNSEMANWLEQKEKQSELLGGAGYLLANNQADPYLSQAVLDLQFSHSQRVGYDVAVKVLQQLRDVTPLHKRLPEHASLGVLRSPDIPSLLVETGFISNSVEERLLRSSVYQERIARSIYKGLRNYFLAYPLQLVPKKENLPLFSAKAFSLANNQTGTFQYTGVTLRHTMPHGNTFLSAAKSSRSMLTMRNLNKIKKRSMDWTTP